ncbi:MAG: hypothetical protein R3E86_10110 [Pseudomonadales bacterium]
MADAPELADLQQHIEAVESAYEFMLAYAAQGRRDEAAGSGPRVRDVLSTFCSALDAIEPALPDPLGAFREVVLDDIRKTRAALHLVLSRAAISSELVDNLNASIHVRALLTDLFLVSESLSPTT